MNRILFKYLIALFAVASFGAEAKTERTLFDAGWRFARFGLMPDGSTLIEPGLSKPPITASSEESPSLSAEKAIDGNKSTRWCSNGMKPGQWLELDLGKTAEIGAVNITWEKAGVHNYKLEGSENGKKWVLLATKGGNDREADNGECNLPVSASYRYLKLTVPQVSTNNWASVCEFVVLNKKNIPIIPITSKAKEHPPCSPLFNDSKWRLLNLPHDWGTEGPFRVDLENETGKLPWAGIGWYRKQFTPPAADAGKSFFLDFDGVMSHPKVYVNGELAGEWGYGYASFRINITKFIKLGQPNTIAVRVDNPPNSSRWYPGGGIYRHVYLTKCPPVHVAHWGVNVNTPEVTTAQARVSATVTVDNDSTKADSYSVKLELLDGSSVVQSMQSDGQDVPTKGATKFHFSMLVANPKLWDTQTPHLYTLKSTVLKEDEVVDEHTIPIGIRKIEWKADGFYLNDRRFQLKGVCQHHDLGPLGGAVHQRGYDRQVEILKSFGCNSIRTSHNPPAPELLIACDRMGILVIDELFDMWELAKKGNDYHRLFPEWSERDLVNFVARDRNHPCVIAWSTGNEIPEQGRKDKHSVSRRLTDLFHREDSTRIVTVGCNNPNAWQNGFADTVDVYGFNYKPDMYPQFEQARPNQPYYASETSSCVSTRGEYFFPVPTNWSNYNAIKQKGFFNYQVSSYDLFAPGWAYWPDKEFEAQERNPKCAGEYVWTGFDYLGEPTPYNLDATNMNNFFTEADKKAAMEQLAKFGNKAPSRSSYFGIVDLCGFPKDRFYLYQAHWRPDLPMAHILPHWTWQERKGQVTPVHVYTSGDEAELFLNGKSLGKKKKEQYQYRLKWDDVVYEPGKLEVITYKKGKEWARAKQITAGPPAQIEVTTDRTELTADGQDLAYVTIRVLDKNGTLVPRANNQLFFRVAGPADIVAVCNGDPTDFTPMTITPDVTMPKIKAFNGMGQVIIRTKAGANGTIKLSVKADGIPTAKTIELISR